MARGEGFEPPLLASKASDLSASSIPDYRWLASVAAATIAQNAFFIVAEREHNNDDKYNKYDKADRTAYHVGDRNDPEGALYLNGLVDFAVGKGAGDFVVAK